jgi:Na+-driven multidrug efflux pump
MTNKAIYGSISQLEETLLYWNFILKEEIIEAGRRYLNIRSICSPINMLKLYGNQFIRIWGSAYVTK